MKHFFKTKVFLELCILFILSLLPLFWLKPGQVVIGHDSGFRINFFSYYRSLLYAWNPIVNFGIDWQLFKGFLMTQFPEFIFTVLSGSWVVGQRMMMVMWFFLMQVSMYFLARTLKPEKEHWVFRMSAGIFYAFNFYILQAWFIVERAKFSLYAALPLSILLFYQVFEKKKPILTHAILFGLLYLFANGGGSTPLYGATFVVWTITFVYFTFLQWKGRKMQGIRFAARVALMFGAAFLLINAYWIIPQIGLYISTYKTAVAERGGVDGLIAWERVNSKNASILNLLRLQGVPDWYDNPNNTFSAEFTRNPLLIAASFIPAFTIALGLLFSAVRRQRLHKIVYLACILLGVGLIVGGGSHPPFGIFYEYAMRHLPGFAIFRSSFYKFGPLVWFSIIILFSYFIDRFLFMVKGRVRTILGVCIVAGILVYHYPFFTKDIFHFAREFTTRVKVPQYVSTMADYINANTDKSARVMILPELTSSFYNVQMDAYTWGFFSLDILPRNAIDRSVIANDMNAPDFIFNLYTQLNDGRPADFIKLAGYAGIRYILWRDDAKYSDTVINGRTIAFQKSRVNAVVAGPVFRADAWQLYDLGPSQMPLVWTPQEVAVTQHKVEHASEFLLTSSATSSAVIEGTTLPENVIEATCLYCQLGLYDKMVYETPQPTLRFKPGSPLFSRLLSSDKNAIRTAGSDPEALFNAMLAHSQLQLAILASPVKPKGYDRQAVITDVEQSFVTARKQIDKLTGRQKNVYAIRLMLYLDVSDRFYPGITSLTAMRKEIEPSVWMTGDPSDIKYEFETSQAGTYELDVTSVATAPAIDIDGVVYGVHQTVSIPAGYHTARIVRPATVGVFAPQLFLKKNESSFIATPSIAWTKVNPTKYRVDITDASQKFILALNEAFDRRWKVTGVDEKDHGKLNGFGNAWVMEKTGTYTVYITYQPQQLFIIGAIITGISLLCSVYIIRKQ